MIHAIRIWSLVAFKNVNRYSRAIADTVPKFRAVKAHAPFVHRGETKYHLFIEQYRPFSER